MYCAKVRVDLRASPAIKDSWVGNSGNSINFLVAECRNMVTTRPHGQWTVYWFAHASAVTLSPVRLYVPGRCVPGNNSKGKRGGGGELTALLLPT